MIRKLEVTITTSTETTGESNDLMEEILADITDNISWYTDKAGKMGDIERNIYEVMWEYKVEEIE